MKLKMKLLAPLFAVLMLGTATSAFADLLCEVRVTQTGTTAGTPVLNVVNNGHWESAADLLFNCAPGGTNPGQATSDASITIYYSGLTISNTPTTPAPGGRAHNVRVIYGGTGTDYGVVLDTTRTDIGGSGVNQGNSLVALTLPAQAATAGSFTVQNVLLSIAGGPAAGPIGVNVNIITPNGSVSVSPVTPMPVTVITNVKPLLNNSSAPPTLVAHPLYPAEPAGPAQFTPQGTNPPASIVCSTPNCRNNRATFSLVLTEDHVDSFRGPASYYQGIGNNGLGTTQNGTNVLYTFSGMLPGSVVTNCVLTPTAGAGMTWTLTGSGIAGTNGQTTLVAEALVVPPATLAAGTPLDTLTLSCGTSMANPAYGVGTSSGNASSNITVVATPFPTGGPLAPPGGTVESGGTPRYATTGGAVGPVTVISFGAAAVGQTMMIIPYALANVACGTGCTYDTGISIANTTKDAVFGTDAQGAAPDTKGSLQFNFYPADGAAPFTITPNTGFNLVNGEVISGNSFVGTLSAVLRSDNRTAAFQGYIILVANFTHAHGTAYVYGGSAADRLTAAADVLVISNPIGPGFGRAAYAATVGAVEQTEK